MWSKLYKQCTDCGTTSTKHSARGLCKKCYRSFLWQREKAKMQTNPELKARYNSKQNKWVRSNNDYYRKLKNKRYSESEHIRMIKKIHNQVKKAVDTGVIIKLLECQICKSNIKVEGHHPDYSKPLEVIWLCQICHIKKHKIIN